MEMNNTILNIYKPVGITSFDVVRIIRRATGIKKVGHGGTLDPFAEGVLLIMTGNKTKKMQEILMYNKVYEAILKLGQSTETGDPTGRIIGRCDIPEIEVNLLEEVQKKFTGKILQEPPIYSAKKINGIPAYKYARRGEKIKLEAKEVNILDLSLRKISHDKISIYVECGSGTYIRKLGEDIARELGTCGYLVNLKRLRVGPYKIEDSIKIDRFLKLIEVDTKKRV